MTYISDNFPTDNTADTLATITKFDQLVRDGFLDDQQAAGVLDAIGTYIDTIAEAYPLVSAVYAGVAGAVSRKYAVVPKYALPATALGQNLTFLANSPPQGRAPASAVASAANNAERTSRYGKLAASTTVASTAATLDGTHTVTVTLPAASADFPDVKFDLLVQDDITTPGPWQVIKTDLAASAVVVDTGLARAAYSIAPNTNPRFKHSEVGVDTTGTHIIVYGSLVYVEGGNA